MTTIHDERYYYQQQQFIPMDEIDNDPFIAEALSSMWKCHTSMIEEVKSLRAIDEEIEACQREALKLEQQLMQNTTRVGMDLLDRVKHIPEAWDMVLQAHEMIQESWLRETGEHYTSNVYEGQFASSYDSDMLRKWLSNFIREVLQQPNVDDAWQRIGSTKFRPYFAGAHKIFLRCLIKERIAIDNTFSIEERLKMYAADANDDDSSISKKKEEASADATTTTMIYPSLPAIPRDDDNLEKYLPILPSLSYQYPYPSAKKKTTDLNRFVTRAKRIKKKYRITTTMRIGTDSRDISKRPLTALQDDDDEEEEEQDEDADAAMESGQEDEEEEEEEEEASEDDESDEDEDEDEDDLDDGELDDLMKDAANSPQSQQEDYESSSAAAPSSPHSQEPESPRPPSPYSPPPPVEEEEAEVVVVPETLNHALQNSMQYFAAMLVADSRYLQEIQVDRNGVYIQQQLYASCARIWETLYLQMVGFRRGYLENVDDYAKISFSIQAMIGIAFIAYSPAAVASNDLLSSMLQRINQADPADQTQANLIFGTLYYAARKTILNDALLMRPRQQQRDFMSAYADMPTTVQDNIAAIITRYLENYVLYDVRYITFRSSYDERDAWARENGNMFIPVPELLLVPWITNPEDQRIVLSYRDRPADSETAISKAFMVTLQYALEQLVDDYYTRELADPNRTLSIEMPMLHWMIDMAALTLMHRLRSDTQLITGIVLNMRWALQRYGMPSIRQNTGAISFVFPLDKWDELRGHLLSPLMQHYRYIRGVMTQYKISFTRRLAYYQVPFEHLPLRTPLAIFSVLYRYWMQEMNFERFEPHVQYQQQQALPRWTIAEMEYIATRYNTGIGRLGIADRLLLLIQDVTQDGIVHRAELRGAFEYMEQRLFESIRAQYYQQQQQQYY